jgi:hypothetical protein
VVRGSIRKKNHCPQGLEKQKEGLENMSDVVVVVSIIHIHSFIHIQTQGCEKLKLNPGMHCRFILK